MFRMGSKGIAAILAINIFLVFAAISLVIFVSFFTYTITVARQQTVTEGRNSLLPLAVVNSEYLDGNNLAVALAEDETQTSLEIESKLNTLAPSTCYKLVIGGITVRRSGVNINEREVPCRSDEYNFRTVFVFPQIFDGKNFVIPGEFETYDK